MKKKILSLLIIAALCIFPKNAFALSVSTSCSSATSITTGNTVSVTVRGSASDSVMWDASVAYDTSKLQYVGGSSMHYISDNFSSSLSLTYKFKAIATGSASVRVANVEVANAGGESGSSHNGTCTINISEPVPEKPKNTDNNLKSLSIDGAELSPAFNKDTLEYSANFKSDVTKININAEKNDSKASVSGTGEKDVVEGTNRFEIVVKAENGSTKTYIINAIVAEKDPIVVKVNGRKLNVVRKKELLTAPEGFVETTLKIKDEDIPAFKNEIIGYTLIGLTDKDGNINLYIYDENKLTYKKYNEIKANGARIIVLKFPKSKVPYKYYESSFEYNGNTINGYTFDEDSDFRLLYALNVENGEKNVYVFDKKENTIQRFYNAQTEIYIELVKKCKSILSLSGLVSIVLLLLLIISLRKNTKIKKQFIDKVESSRKHEVELPKEEIKYKNIEETSVFPNIEEENVNSKKEEKQRIKELKKQQKEDAKRIKKEDKLRRKEDKKEQKTFLDD